MRLMGTEVDTLVVTSRRTGASWSCTLLLSSVWPSVAEGAERCSPAESPLMGARVRAHVTSFGKFGAKGHVLELIFTRPVVSAEGTRGKARAPARADASAGEAAAGIK